MSCHIIKNVVQEMVEGLPKSLCKRRLQTSSRCFVSNNKVLNGKRKRLLGNYTHKVAITRHRIVAITEHSVTFKYKDYQDGSKQKTMPLSITEFLRRFELHFLPRQYVKIRHYGFLQNTAKQPG